ncbi:uncharacterized protein [Arachis hypogaea]|uniref:uncharacterized protein n=1 Tax=Arachis hypogaea TaxID=3818 RepID=UPI003B20D051
MNFMRNTESRKGTLTFNIDLEKAYDKVDWRFLEASLVRFGFPSATINLIMACVMSSSLAILWNGDRLQNFNSNRGLRQGNLIFSYLFVLCMEALACFITHRISQGSWIPMSVSRDGSKISNLMFNDDLLHFCKDTKAHVEEVMQTMDLFSKASGLKDLGRYLGVNIGHERSSKRTAQKIIQKIHKKLASWKGCLLNKAGRLCLVKSGMAYILVYNMQIALLPKFCSGGFCGMIDIRRWINLQQQFLLRLRDIVCEMDCLDILHLLHDSAGGYKSEVVDLVNKIQELLSRPWYVQFD